ncbi:MAG: hypothetical protein D6722_16810 [Bacteroidetes bacterium]|nr:MAG: hypothetical protein D6722_16810 [Bacteroidota bacterium]
MILLLTTGEVWAQYGTQYTFSLDLLDPAYLFHSREDAPQIRARSRAHRVSFRAGASRYRIEADGKAAMRVEAGRVHFDYGVVPPGNQLSFWVIREAGRQRDSLRVQLHNLEDGDFVALCFRPGRLEVDLWFGRNPLDFRLVTDTLSGGERDLSPLLNGQGSPSWTETPARQARRAEAARRQAAAMQARLQPQADSLLALVLPDAADLFALRCAQSRCDGPEPLPCTLTPDTACRMATFTYALRKADIPVPPVIIQAYDRAGTHLMPPYHATAPVAREALALATPAQVRAYPEVAFVSGSQGAVLLSLQLMTSPPRPSSQGLREPMPVLVPPAPPEPEAAFFVYLAYSPVPEVPDLMYLWFLDGRTGKLRYKDAFLNNGPDQDRK